jgi:hypothetical protein
MTGSIAHLDARLVWSPGHPEQFAVVTSTPDDYSGEQNRLQELWGGKRTSWRGPARNDSMFSDEERQPLNGAAYVAKLEQIFIELTVHAGVDPKKMFSELKKIDLWHAAWID